MPHIIIKGAQEEHVKEISETLIPPMAEIIKCPEDHITIEYLPTVFYQNGVAGQGAYPFVSIQWFKRDETTCKQVAELFNAFFIQKKYAENAVIFTDLIPTYYFENGQHF